MIFQADYFESELQAKIKKGSTMMKTEALSSFTKHIARGHDARKSKESFDILWITSDQKAYPHVILYELRSLKRCKNIIFIFSLTTGWVGTCPECGKSQTWGLPNHQSQPHPPFLGRTWPTKKHDITCVKRVSEASSPEDNLLALLPGPGGLLLLRKVAGVGRHFYLLPAAESKLARGGLLLFHWTLVRVKICHGLDAKQVGRITDA